MDTRKIVLEVEIDTTDFELTKESLWELNFKIEDWCLKKGFIKKCRITKFEKKKQKRREPNG